MKKRIAITGYGIKVPNGEDNQEFLNNLITGNYQFTKRTDLSPNQESVFMGDLVGDLGDLDDKKHRVLPRFSKLAIKTTSEALEMSGLSESDIKKSGVFFGTCMGGTGEIENVLPLVFDNKYNKIPIYGCGLVHYHSLASSISSYFNIDGVSKTITTGCTSGVEALEEAVMYLLSGKIKTAIVGGSDSSNSKTMVYGFGKIKGIAFNQNDEYSGSPFNKKSKGFIISEGASTLILELEEHAIERNAHIYGYIDEIETNNDASTINGVDSTGSHMKNAVNAVLKNRTPDYYNSQALGYRSNDDVESIISSEVFENKVPLTTIKGLIGHPLGVSGLAQVVASLLGFQYDFIPKTIRTNKEGYEHIPLIMETIHTKTNEVLITSHGYGGNNACIYLTRN